MLVVFVVKTTLKKKNKKLYLLYLNYNSGVYIFKFVKNIDYLRFTSIIGI